MKKYLTIFTVLLSGLVIAGTASNAKESQPAMEPMNSDLGVTCKQFKSCYKKYVYVGELPKPTEAQLKTNKTKFLNCLQKENKNLTLEQVETTMEGYHSAGSMPCS
jgi:hypothetical protein